MSSKPNRRPIDISAIGSAAMPQPDPVQTVVNQAAMPKPAANAPPPVVEPAAVAEEERVEDAAPAERAKPRAKAVAVKEVGRAGKVAVQVWVHPDKRRKLKRYAVNKERTVDGLLIEALDDLMRKLKIE